MESGSHDEDDVKHLMGRNSVQQPPMGPEIEVHDERRGHRDGGLGHHNSALMHQMMHGQAIHHGHPPHVSPQLGLTGHGYPHTPGQHHMSHGQGYHSHQHQNPPYHPLPHNHRGQPSHYQHHSSYHQGPML